LDLREKLSSGACFSSYGTHWYMKVHFAFSLVYCSFLLHSEQQNWNLSTGIVPFGIYLSFLWTEQGLGTINCKELCKATGGPSAYKQCACPIALL
jgi:hypothetical protein